MNAVLYGACCIITLVTFAWVCIAAIKEKFVVFYDIAQFFFLLSFVFLLFTLENTLILKVSWMQLIFFNLLLPFCCWGFMKSIISVKILVNRRKPSLMKFYSIITIIALVIYGFRVYQIFISKLHLIDLRFAKMYNLYNYLAVIVIVIISCVLSDFLRIRFSKLIIAYEKKQSK